MSLPLNRLIESRYCQDYYRGHNPLIIHHGNRIPEDLCKIDKVQEQLAVLQGIIETLHVFCGQELYSVLRNLWLTSFVRSCGYTALSLCLRQSRTKVGSLLEHLESDSDVDCHYSNWIV
jgi:hypothetical protein